MRDLIPENVGIYFNVSYKRNSRDYWIYWWRNLDILHCDRKLRKVIQEFTVTAKLTSKIYHPEKWQ